MAPDRTELAASFEARFGAPPARIVRAPGRVNLIGEHTDYNEGFVFPLAIDREVVIALAPRDDRTVRAVALDVGRRGVEANIDLDALERGDGWQEYLKGTAWALQEAGHELRGFDAVIRGDVPRGAGLSSSAALELAVARAFHASSGFDWDPPAIARLAQRAENAWVGVNSGIMDQLISATGRAGHAVLTGCRSLEATPAPLPPGTRVVVLDTGTRRGLVGSAYNERRAQCEAAAEAFGVPALRDVGIEALEAAGDELEPLPRRRARHVVTENARTLAAFDAMKHGDAATLGRLMDASHASLRDDFEVSSDALDAMVDAARAHPGCLGARMTGAGFGGCAVALVEADAVEAFADRVPQRYESATGNDAAIYVVRASDGASTVS